MSGMVVAPDLLPTEVRSRPLVPLILGTADDLVALGSMALAADTLGTEGVPE